MDNLAKYFHQVYRRVFQLTCVLHLEPESSFTLIMSPHLTVHTPDIFGAIIFRTFQVTYLMIYELACSERRLLTKYRLAL